MMSGDRHLAASSRRVPRHERRDLLPPVDRPSCGSSAGANRHYKEKEHLCGGCELAMKERTRAYNAQKHGIGEFSKLSEKWVCAEPWTRWRLLQTEELEDGLYLSGPIYTQIRVPKGQFVGEVEVGGNYTVSFKNAEATYKVAHASSEFVYLEIIRSSIRSWLDLLQERHL